MTPINSKNLPKHVAIIMDGNGRWARKRKVNRVHGHRKGADTVREIVRTSREIGIDWLTLYAFSEENWKRSRTEIQALMKLLKRFLKSQLAEMLENGIRLQTIGRSEKLPEDTRRVLFDTIEKTGRQIIRCCRGLSYMVLTLALSYGGRQEIIDAIKRLGFQIEEGRLSAGHITERLISDSLYTAGMPDPDLLIRTSGEYRISNFLLWQIAYTELYITSTLWPDFGREEFLAAILDFQKRERRFGSTED